MAHVDMAKKTTTSKQNGDKSSNVMSAEKVTETIKNTAIAGLGVVGILYDRVQGRVEEMRKEAPRQWKDFVKRGEQLRDTTNNKVNSFSFSYEFDMEEQRAQFRDVVDALRAFVTPSKT